MKDLFLIFLILTSTNASAFFWNSKIKILCYGTKSVDLIYTYELKEKEIYETIIMPKKETNTGKDELISLTKLEDCTIKDSKNWSCGGKTSHEISGTYRSELHTVFEGRYRYTSGTAKLDLCIKKIQSN